MRQIPLAIGPEPLPTLANFMVGANAAVLFLRSVLFFIFYFFFPSWSAVAAFFFPPHSASSNPFPTQPQPAHAACGLERIACLIEKPVDPHLLPALDSEAESHSAVPERHAKTAWI
jgi:hypothetical protein